ncbi:hypothetical protein BKA93DRAFT_441611 [Sparassis latifolia]
MLYCQWSISSSARHEFWTGAPDLCDRRWCREMSPCCLSCSRTSIFRPDGPKQLRDTRSRPSASEKAHRVRFECGRDDRRGGTSLVLLRMHDHCQWSRADEANGARLAIIIVTGFLVRVLLYLLLGPLEAPNCCAMVLLFRLQYLRETLRVRTEVRDGAELRLGARARGNL